MVFALFVKMTQGNSCYPFVLGTNTYGCWYYPDSHADKSYAGSAFWGAASSEAQMRDPDPGAAHHVRLKCDGSDQAPIENTSATESEAVTQQEKAKAAAKLQASTNAMTTAIKAMCNVTIAVCEGARQAGQPVRRWKGECMEKVLQTNAQCNEHCMRPNAEGSDYYNAENYFESIINDWIC
jgi:hypothetical protein